MAAWLSGYPLTEVRQGQPVAYLAGEAIELRSAAAGRSATAANDETHLAANGSAQRHHFH